MRLRLVSAGACGLIVACAVAGFPASASDASIAAGAGSWSPNTATIDVGDSVTWTNSGGIHNICVQKPGNAGTACDEFRNGDPDPAWTSASHRFTVAGTYAFFCEAHKSLGMTGTITVTA